jgi:hypothetical protein
MKANTKVILKTEKYVDDKYNPRNLVGLILETEGKFHPIEVRWSNGIKNAYYFQELGVVNENK